MKELIKNLKYTWQFTKDQKSKLIKYIICNTISIVISVILPILSAKIIIHLTQNELKQLIMISGVICLIEMLRNIINNRVRYYSQVIYRESFTNIQKNLGKSILKIENSCIDTHSSGLFIQRLTNDTSRLAEVFNFLNSYITNIITDIGIYMAVLIICKPAFLYLIITTSIAFFIENIRTKKYMEKDEIYRKKNERVSGFVGEIVRGIRDIKMLNAEDSFMEELNKKVIDVNTTRYNMQATDRKFHFIAANFYDIQNFLLIVLLVWLIKEGHLAIASALIIHNYSSRIYDIVYYAGNLLERIRDFNLSCNRIFSIMDSVEFKKEIFGTKHIDKVEGNFEFKDVTFKYEKEKVLDDISFKINANETVAFVGKSGAGKTTIFNLLCKMYDVKKGIITIDGVDINELDKDSIRGNITIISQNPYIFNLTIRENLKLVKSDLTEKEMKEACKTACLEEFINKLPDKYDTLIGEGGINLSGGQKQRLAIARALIQKTEIILFDEATSSLDNETQTSIQKAIENMKNEYTILIIAHRLSTIINSDRILFLNNGKIEAEGTHQQLLQQSNEYKKLYESEISKDNTTDTLL